MGCCNISDQELHWTATANDAQVVIWTSFAGRIINVPDSQNKILEKWQWWCVLSSVKLFISRAPCFRSFFASNLKGIFRISFFWEKFSIYWCSFLINSQFSKSWSCMLHYMLLKWGVANNYVHWNGLALLLIILLLHSLILFNFVYRPFMCKNL